MQTLPHAPQFFGSLCMNAQALPQVIAPCPHTQLPFTHVLPAAHVEEQVAFGGVALLLGLQPQARRIERTVVTKRLTSRGMAATALHETRARQARS